ncbi:MAG: TRAP transporter large permease subunit [Bdellovibrionales bacterium]|nr:TRAP transporter large permease subunit [Bdellovibrionales bacterium]
MMSGTVSDEALALLMVATLFVLLMAGFPVAFTLGGVALVFGAIGLGVDFFQLLPYRIFGVIENVTLLAVPLFVYMGVMLERSGIAEDLLASMSLLFGRLRGGLALAVVISGALLAASTGIVGASVVTMGLISLPVMLSRGYPASFSSGLICASGTLGQIIPPSVVLILLGDIMGVSVGELFLAAVVPGLLLVAAYALYSICYCARFATDVASETLAPTQLLQRLGKALLPPGALVLAVLGSIFFGIASPTEAAAVGAAGSMILAALYGRLSRTTLQEVMQRTMQLTAMVFMILFGAQAFGLVFRGLNGDHAIATFVQSLQLDAGGFLLVVMVLLFVLGCFLDFIEIVFIVIPILTPLLGALGIPKLWFAVVVAMNLQMSFLTPPFGFSLFFLKGVAPPEVNTGHIYRGIVPFVVLQALVLTILILYPELVLWLPKQASAR